MRNYRPASTAIDPKTCLVKASNSDPVFEQNLDQRMMGSLMYLVTCTGTHLPFAMSYLFHFSSHALLCHHTAVKSVFRYLAATRSMPLKYQPSPTWVLLPIFAFSDLDSTSCQDTRRSLSGYGSMLNSGSISWLSKQQWSVASSSTGQNIGLLPLHPGKQSGTSINSHNSVMLSSWWWWQNIPSASTLLRTESIIFELSASTLLIISLVYISFACPLPIPIYYLTIT